MPTRFYLFLKTKMLGVFYVEGMRTTVFFDEYADTF